MDLVRDRRNAATHALLESNKTDWVICMQEPWFGRIGTTRMDSEREGLPTLGGASHPDYLLFYPYFTDSKRAKVMTYVKKQINNHLSPLRVLPRLDLVTHNTILITDLHFGMESLRIINFYHDMDDPSSLRSLLHLDLDPTIPTILIGDFNLHSPRWSPSGLSTSPRV